jgi:sugar phosphate isomerase/epimerase
MEPSICLEFVFPELDLPARMAAVARLGFASAEIWEWRGRDLPALRRAADAAGVAVAGLCATGPELGPGDPVRGAEAEAGVRAALAAAETLGCRWVVVMAGEWGGPAGPGGAGACGRRLDALSAGLRRLGGEAAGRGLRLLLEGLNPAEFPRYLLHRPAELAAVAAAAGHPAVGVVLDLYHAVRAGEDPVEAVRSCGGVLRHLHLAGAPGRGEPWRAVPELLPAVEAAVEQGVEGIGLEYRPAGDHARSLLRARRWLAAAPRVEVAA